jgi:hypothetical protein
MNRVNCSNVSESPSPYRLHTPCDHVSSHWHKTREGGGGGRERELEFGCVVTCAMGVRAESMPEWTKVPSSAATWGECVN